MWWCCCGGGSTIYVPRGLSAALIGDFAGDPPYVTVQSFNLPSYDFGIVYKYWIVVPPRNYNHITTLVLFNFPLPAGPPVATCTFDMQIYKADAGMYTWNWRVLDPTKNYSPVFEPFFLMSDVTGAGVVPQSLTIPHSIDVTDPPLTITTPDLSSLINESYADYPLTNYVQLLIEPTSAPLVDPVWNIYGAITGLLLEASIT